MITGHFYLKILWLHGLKVEGKKVTKCEISVLKEYHNFKETHFTQSKILIMNISLWSYCALLKNILVVLNVLAIQSTNLCADSGINYPF